MGASNFHMILQLYFLLKICCNRLLNLIHYEKQVLLSFHSFFDDMVTIHLYVCISYMS